MTDFKMEIIPKPKENEVTLLRIKEKGECPIVKGIGTDNYLCGICANVICKNVEVGQIKNIVFQCPNCNSYNFIGE